MSEGFYNNLADIWQDSKIDGLGYLNPQEGAEDVMKNDSRAMESLGKKWNLPWLQNEAHGNVSDPARGIGKASTAVAAAYAGGAAGGLLGGSGGGGAVPAMYEMGGPAAQQAAAQMAMNGGNAAGLLGTMESGLTDTGYTPSSLFNAARYGPESGQTFGQTMGNWAGQKMSNLGNSLKNGQVAKRYAFRQGMDMMQPQQPMQAPMQRFQQPQQQTPLPYGQLTEEQKELLRQQGYLIY